MFQRILRVVCMGVSLVGASVALAQQSVPTPADVYGELFEQVQLNAVYPDSKSFVDALPNRPPEQVLSEYRELRKQPGFDLKKFVAERFSTPPNVASDFRTVAGQDVRQHIDALWKVLERKPEDQRPHTSRLALPHRYVVPGGRFNEIYYWDSYFTMQGLEESGRHDLTLDMIANFGVLIDNYGHIPNGNRSYFLSRSQPPFFGAMIELAAVKEGDAIYKKYLPQLVREYQFWMDGVSSLKRDSAHRRVVKLPDGAVLNRYYDDRNSPREEAYKEDLATAKLAGPGAPEIYRNLRAAAESGWDFSSRWFAGKTLATIHTIDLIPPDLNSLLYRLELTIAKGCELNADPSCAKEMKGAAQARKAAMTRYLWNQQAGAFTDYDWRAKKLNAQVTAATVYPLYFEIATKEQGKAVAATVRSSLLRPHGLATTSLATGEQWDEPNGWAPLQWLAIQGLKNYGEDQLAATIAQRWVGKNLQVFKATGKLVEKYDVDGDKAGGGGEYPLQDGFGWTNGVLRKLLTLYPKLAQ
ncbi:alpha,alpha-trehalase TreF [Steroidobacter sp.]|uniref:alpha,alpha-trehalase TreF n=1 Tax=Steroidobacter sp. TaxID=1978227 RepID=UPI001A61C03E|nr:alpha,alpha-trehalase TreF [Steroidobacter sp.]MBL8268223.1 alpha,alpha-trehalase TreF [Steroidobacter sp.]